MSMHSSRKFGDVRTSECDSREKLADEQTDTQTHTNTIGGGVITEMPNINSPEAAADAAESGDDRGVIGL